MKPQSKASAVNTKAALGIQGIARKPSSGKASRAARNSAHYPGNQPFDAKLRSKHK